MKPASGTFCPGSIAMSLAICGGLLTFSFGAFSQEAPSRLVEGTFELPLGSEKIEFFYQVSAVQGKAPIVISLHRNESVAFPLLRNLLREYPGRFVGIKTPGSRRLSLKGGESKAFTIDPNRIFTEDGIERDLKQFSFFSPEIAGEIKSFSAAYLEKVKMERGTTVIAVHNNTDGGYSIESYRKGGGESAAAADLSVSAEWDPDDFILVTHPEHFRSLKEMQFNVVLQDNAGAPDDGSLSVYCGRAGIDYFNVEAEFGHSAEQDKMLRAVFALATGIKPSPAGPVPGAAVPVAKPIKSNAVKLDNPAGTPPVEPGKTEKDNPQPKTGLRLFRPKNTP